MVNKTKAIFDKVLFNRDYFVFNRHNELVGVLEDDEHALSSLEQLKIKHGGKIDKGDLKSLQRSDLQVIRLLSKFSCFGLSDSLYTDSSIYNIEEDIEKFFGSDLEDSDGFIQMHRETNIGNLLQDVSKMLVAEYNATLEHESSSYLLHQPNPFAILQLFLIKIAYSQFGELFMEEDEISLMFCDALPACDRISELDFVISLYTYDLDELLEEFKFVDVTLLENFLSAIHSFTPKRKCTILAENMELFSNSSARVQDFVKNLIEKLYRIENTFNFSDGEYITRHTKIDSSLTENFQITDYQKDNNLALIALLTGEEFFMVNKDGETTSEFTLKDVYDIPWDLPRGVNIEVDSEGSIAIQYPMDVCTIKVETKFKDILSKGKFIKRMNSIETLSQYVFEEILKDISSRHGNTDLVYCFDDIVNELNYYENNHYVTRHYASSLTAFNFGVVKYAVDYKQSLKFNKPANEGVKYVDVGIRRLTLPYSYKLDNLITSDKPLEDALTRFTESSKSFVTDNLYVNAFISFMFSSMAQMYKDIDSNTLRDIITSSDWTDTPTKGLGTVLGSMIDTNPLA